MVSQWPWRCHFATRSLFPLVFVFELLVIIISTKSLHANLLFVTICRGSCPRDEWPLLYIIYANVLPYLGGTSHSSYIRVCDVLVHAQMRGGRFGGLATRLLCQDGTHCWLSLTECKFPSSLQLVVSPPVPHTHTHTHTHTYPTSIPSLRCRRHTGVPAVKRPGMGIIVITDGAADDNEELSNTLLHIPLHCFVLVVVIGNGEFYFDALDEFQAVARRQCNLVRVIGLGGVGDADTIASTMITEYVQLREDVNRLLDGYGTG